jgi:hypothetical protein
VIRVIKVFRLIRVIRVIMIRGIRVITCFIADGFAGDNGAAWVSECVSELVNE